MKSIQYEELSKARTYIIVNEEQLLKSSQSDNNHNGLLNLKILGYFSLALKVLSVPESYSNNQRKNIDGLSAKIHGDKISDFPCYLIGQLSRNSAVDKSIISGDQIIKFAFSIIKSAMLNIGGRAIMIECRNEKKLIEFYSKNGFKLLDSIPDGNNKMIQMIQIVCEQTFE